MSQCRELLFREILARVAVGQFAERFRAEVIPLSNTFGYFCASLPISEIIKEYLEEPVAALPTNIAGVCFHQDFHITGTVSGSARGDRGNEQN